MLVLHPLLHGPGLASLDAHHRLHRTSPVQHVYNFRPTPKSLYVKLAAANVRCEWITFIISFLQRMAAFRPD